MLSFGLSSLGIIILGLSINLLSWQFKLVSGGFPGYALVLNYLTGFPVGESLLIANTLVLIISLFVAGKTAGLKGIYGYTFLSIFIEFSKQFLHLHQIVISSLVTNIILASLQGFTASIGIALVITCGYSFGSYSSMLPIADRIRKISPPIFFFFFDSVLTLITWMFFGINKAFLLFVNAGVFFLTFKYALLIFQKYKQYT